MSSIKDLATMSIISLVGLTGCDDTSSYSTKHKPIEGIVEKESGTIIDRQAIVEHSGDAKNIPEFVNLGNPTYVIHFKADNGLDYTFQISPRYVNMSSLDALNLAINKGTRVRISKWNSLKGSVGITYDQHVEVLRSQ